MKALRFVRAALVGLGIQAGIPVLLILTSPAYSQKSAEWKGRIEKDGEVVVVMNPNKPLYGPGALVLEEDLAVGGGEGEDIVFAEIRSGAVADDGTIFVLDWKDKNIKAFDAAGGFLGTIGRAGEGPGELSLPRSIHVHGPDEIVVIDGMRRLSFFKRDGEYVRDLSTGAQTRLMDTQPDGCGNFFVYRVDWEKSDYELWKVDGELKDLFMIESSPLQNSARDGYNPFFPVLSWARLSGERIVCGYPVKPEFRIFDATGRLIRRIRIDPKRVSVDEEDVKERTMGEPPSSLQNLKIPRHFPAFRSFATDDEDRIYVLSWERPPGRKGFYFDILDDDGRYIARTVLPVFRPIIRKGRLYALEETEEGYQVIKRYVMHWNLDRPLP